MKQTVVLAYSGGLDTSVCVKWLSLRGYRVVCFMANVGQGEPALAAVKRAKIAGAARVIVRDLRAEFIKDYVWPSLRANAIYEGKYPLATALSRPLIAKHLIDVAHQTKAQAIAHGCTGKGNDQVRFELTSRILDPSIEILAPVRTWEFRSREDEIAYAANHKIPIDVTKRSSYSIDSNLWGTSIESGVLEDPWVEPPKDTYRSVKPVEEAASKPEYVRIEFNKGIPIRINGAALKPIKLIERLNKMGGAHGIGRSDIVESRLVGIKSREIYEAPAATILLEAHSDLERLVCDRELLQLKATLSVKYAQVVYDGLWFTPIKQALDGFIEKTQKNVIGVVRLKLFKGSCQVVGRRSPKSLYRKHLATYSEDDKFDQSLADGFIKLFGLPYEGAMHRSNN